MKEKKQNQPTDETKQMLEHLMVLIHDGHEHQHRLTEGMLTSMHDNHNAVHPLLEHILVVLVEISKKLDHLSGINPSGST